MKPTYAIRTLFLGAAFSLAASAGNAASEATAIVRGAHVSQGVIRVPVPAKSVVVLSEVTK